MSLTVTKASGKPELFKIQKLVDSLVRSGASRDAAWSIAQKVQAQITPGAPTQYIYRKAKRLLKKYNSVSDMRYSIKNAMYALGPAGYRFEKFFAGILREYGYRAETNRFMKGHCVTHEVDVFAKKAESAFVIECKYHSNSGNATDLKTALYIHSRVEDIKKAFSLKPVDGVLTHEGWLVTNTRCTSDAIDYAECVGLKIVSWKYPKKESLEKMIEDKGLYPVTILSSVKKHSLEALFQNDILFAKDIAEMNEPAFRSRSGLDADLARTLKREADRLCAHRR
jgi:hypothetical protein